MNKRSRILLLLPIFVLWSAVAVWAQDIELNPVKKGKHPKISESVLLTLQKKEDTLKSLGSNIIQAIQPGQRFRAINQFIPLLMRTLKEPFSFYYPFDSLQTISILYPPDSSFRIFTWQFMRDDNFYRQYGVIQINTEDGKLVRHPLFDVSDFTSAPQDSIRTVQNWIGAIYYHLIQKEYQGKKFYTLIGFDDNNIRSNKKWVEVLHFQNGEPVFGGPFFSFKEDSIPKPDAFRYHIEYKKEGRARLNYDEELDMIMVDHLVSEINEPTKKYTLIPDGDYEGFKWVNGKWLHINKVFTFQLKDGEAPVGDQLFDESGKINEEKLRQQSDKNNQKKKKSGG